MSDISAAPVETSAPIDPTIVSPPNPIDVDNVDHELDQREDEKPVKEPKAKDEPKKLTTREALEAAKAKMDAEDKTKPDDKAVKAKAGGKVEPEKKPAERDETGKFKGQEKPAASEAVGEVGEAAKPNAEPGKEPGKAGVVPSHDDPPSRFNAEGKAAWKDTPEHVRAETHRTIRNLEAGIEEHQKRWEPVKKFDDLARQNGTTIPDALERYVAMDMALNEDWEQGLESILRDKGLPPLRTLAAHLLDRKPEDNQQRSDANTQRLEAKIAQLESIVGKVTGHMQKTTETEIDQHVTSFAQDKPWFDALAPRIAEHIKAGMSLEKAAETAHTEAQEQAKALGFIAQTDAPAAAPAAPAVAHRDDRGTKSITGAPGAGSSPETKKPSGSIRETLRRAQAAAGG